MINEREPIPKTEVSRLDLLAMGMKNDIAKAAGPEAIDLGYRILVSLIADQLGPGADVAAVTRTLRSSTDAVAAVLDRLPGGKLPPLHGR